LVVAYMIVPPATAFLLTDRLSRMLVVSAGIAAAGAAAGTLIAQQLDINMAGSVATLLGLMFAVTFVVAPERGLLVQLQRRWRQRHRFFEMMLLIHLLQHEDTPDEAIEAREAGLHEHLNWRPGEVRAIVGRIERQNFVESRLGLLKLTEIGRTRARLALEGTHAYIE